MRFIRAFLLLILFAGNVRSQLPVYYFSEDKVNTGKLSYVRDIRFSITRARDYSWEMSYRVDYEWNGCIEPGFSFVEQAWQAPVNPEQLVKFSESMIAFITATQHESPTPLPSGAKNHSKFFSDRTEYVIDPADDTKVCALLEEFILQNTLPADRMQTHRKLEGDLTPPVDVTFTELMTNPLRFDGRRVRMKGYYRRGFETSEFCADKASQGDYARAVWIGGGSSFVQQGPSGVGDEGYIFVEGTFNAYAKGHLGRYGGTMELITKMTALPWTERYSHYLLAASLVAGLAMVTAMFWLIARTRGPAENAGNNVR